ncbi:threonylcarbamoyl-AMP synthase [Candidatus Dependentiae bacterium]|nr:threonylcarbamoyl-AMP synthase [Candidatus Dependentiae bacterium]
MKKLYYWSDKNIISKIKNSLSNDQVIITSTDTVMGFLANINKKSFEKLTRLKGQRENKPFLIITNSIDKLYKFVDKKNLEHQKIKKLIEKHWPGPLTLIFKAKENLPTFLISKEKTIAIRIPKHKGLQRVLENFEGLFSTSANKTNKPTPKHYNDLDPEVLKNVKFVVTKEENIDTKNKIYKILPSTIIDVSKIKSTYDKVKIVRKGEYPIEELEETYGSKFKK